MKWALKNGKRIEATPKESAQCAICKNEVISKCGVVKTWHWAHKNLEECDSWYEPESEWHREWKNKFPKKNQEFVIGNHRADIRTDTRWIIELQSSPISPENIHEREKYYTRMIWLINGETVGKNISIRVKRKKITCDPRDTEAFNDYENQCFSKYTGESFITFKWKYPPKSWWVASKDIYIDLKYEIPLIKELLKKYESGEEKTYSSSSEEVYNEYTGESYWVSSGVMETTKFTIKSLKEKLSLLENNGTIFLIKNLYKKIPCAGWGILITEKEFLWRFKSGEKKEGC